MLLHLKNYDISLVYKKGKHINELTVDAGIVMKCHKTVIPQSLQREHIPIVHKGHPGVEATKRRARSIIFCHTTLQRSCTHVQCATAPNVTNKRNHFIFTQSLNSHGPKWPQTFSNGVENATKCFWIHIQVGWKFTFSITSSAVVSKLKRHFSVHGTPHTLISYNASHYTSQNFKDFAKQWDFVHVPSSPEYPHSCEFQTTGTSPTNGSEDQRPVPPKRLTLKRYYNKSSRPLQP
ncbi:hypothetical protein F2P81_003952 [Scophthalmus maximus]|nr:hypothetical protein F2P81_003952 [Scophthalmus maximus]